MPSVIVQRREAVLEIVLNRPAVLNAANREMIGELAAAAAEAAEDPAARVVLLRGAGTHFCAGGDINMFGELISLEPAAREQALHAIVDTLHPLLIALRHMPKPVVVAAQGAAAGFGLSLVLAADLAIAAEDCGFHLRLYPSRNQPRWRHDDDIAPHRRAKAGGGVDVAWRPLRCAARPGARPRQSVGSTGGARGRGDGACDTAGERSDPCLRAHQSADRGLGRSNAARAVAARNRKLRCLRRDRRICRGCPRVSRKAPAGFLGSKAVVTKPRRMRWIGLAAVASAGLLSGCYYYPYGYAPWGYPYPILTRRAIRTRRANPYPPAPGAAAQYPQQPAPEYPQQPIPCGGAIPAGAGTGGATAIPTTAGAGARRSR